MLGAIIGDMIGSRFEWRNHRSREFTLLTADCRPTDDSVMTCAVADALCACEGAAEALPRLATYSMQRMGRMFPDAGYGGRFSHWLTAAHPRPYQSLGNGAAMRVSPCAWAAEDAETTGEYARLVTAVTHDHPDAILAAQTVTELIRRARLGADMDELRAVAEQAYGPLRFTLDEIRPFYRFDVTCGGSVPQAIVAFLEGTDYESAVRGAVSIGGDSDTIAAITGSIAAARWGIPEALRQQALAMLHPILRESVLRFEERFGTTY